MENQSSDSANKNKGRLLVWFLWYFLLLTIPFYGFTMIFEHAVIKADEPISYLSPLVGLVVFITQIFVLLRSYKELKRQLPLSKVLLTLVGGTILIAFIWAGGCAMMGTFRIAG